MRIREILRDNLTYIVVAISAVVFLALLQDVRSDDILRLDATAYSFLVLKLRRPWLTTVMEGFSNLSSHQEEDRECARQSTSYVSWA